MYDFPSEAPGKTTPYGIYVEQLNEKPVSGKTWQLLGEPEYNIVDFVRNLKT